MLITDRTIPCLTEKNIRTQGKKRFGLGVACLEPPQVETKGKLQAGTNGEDGTLMVNNKPV